MDHEAANKQLIRRYFAAMEHGDLAAALDCWAADPLNHASGRGGQARSGKQSLGVVFELLRQAFPDRRYQIDELIAEGDRVACRMTVSGVFGGTSARPAGLPVTPDWLGVESTGLAPADAIGRSYSVSHAHMFRIRDGLIAEHWAARDDLALLLQLGAIAPPGDVSRSAG
jgi:predicted ester cyclase